MLGGGPSGSGLPFQWQIFGSSPHRLFHEQLGSSHSQFSLMTINPFPQAVCDSFKSWTGDFSLPGSPSLHKAGSKTTPGCFVSYLALISCIDIWIFDLLTVGYSYILESGLVLRHLTSSFSHSFSFTYSFF